MLVTYQKHNIVMCLSFSLGRTGFRTVAVVGTPRKMAIYRSVLSFSATFLLLTLIWSSRQTRSFVSDAYPRNNHQQECRCRPVGLTRSRGGKSNFGILWSEQRGS
jgi:hypothetical protein